ncbi:hypothetical protein GCM10009817_25340 [Terrabacter lapilli]|uniref:Gas vesicle protein GvpA/GvpJ/GvpM family n=2 Tax=Terrabacter lapilli TaxID=436231 RepID=A0ABN2S9S0_9MICO
MSTVHHQGIVSSGGPSRPVGRPARELAPMALVDLLDRLLGSGVVVAGDVVVSLAGVDLVEIRLHLMISAVRAEMARDRTAAQG